jgi:ecotin
MISSLNIATSNNPCRRPVPTSLLRATILLLAWFGVVPCHATDTLPRAEIQAQYFDSSQYVQQGRSGDSTTGMFPAPKPGMVQHLLTLAPLEDESSYLLEVEVGRTKMIDCNKHGLRGEIIELNLPGSGYIYYSVESVAEGPSTQRACFDGATTEAFVRIPAVLKLPYDSSLPKVFYLPQGVQLRFRVWQVASQYGFSGATLAD